MTDSNATELLRELLDERGVQWKPGMKGVTFAGADWDWCFVEYENGKLAATCEPSLTPEQAVAATLGAGECKVTASSTDGLCTDNPKHWFELSCGHSFTVDGLEKPVTCAICGKKVK